MLFYQAHELPAGHSNFIPSVGFAKAESKWADFTASSYAVHTIRLGCVDGNDFKQIRSGDRIRDHQLRQIPFVTPMKTKPKRFLKIAVFVMAGIAVVARGIYLMLIRSLAGNQVETASEIKVTPEYAAAMRSAGYPISVRRAFEASSYGGWHGDGEALQAFRYLPSESPALIAALKARYPSYVWTDVSSQWALGGLNDLLPADFLPKNRSTPLLAGKPAEGLPFLEFVISSTDGLLYSIDNRF